MKENVESLYCDPNAFIKTNKENSKKVKQVVFSEPYDCLPNYYVNYGFKKCDCECVSKCKDSKCEQKNSPKNKCGCNNSNPFSSLFGGISNLLPMLLNGGDVFNVLSNFNSGNNLQTENLLSKLNLNTENNILTKILSNGDVLSKILNIFKLNNQKNEKIQDIITTDYEIKNYTKV